MATVVTTALKSPNDYDYFQPSICDEYVLWKDANLLAFLFVREGFVSVHCSNADNPNYIWFLVSIPRLHWVIDDLVVNDFKNMAHAFKAYQPSVFNLNSWIHLHDDVVLHKTNVSFFFGFNTATQYFEWTFSFAVTWPMLVITEKERISQYTIKHYFFLHWTKIDWVRIETSS